jgi:hypothetical protein
MAFKMKNKTDIKRKIEERVMMKLKEFREAPMQTEEADEALQQKPKKQLSVHELVIEITKSAGANIKSVEALKKKSMPTKKSQDLFLQAVDALETLCYDMLEHPMEFLDNHPNDVVDIHKKMLDKKEKSLKSE